ncbi:hypothetical protein ZIOFF_051030 [Zingiber officinale]|uniref:Uncharacterized protein n=1 Tax=Zingiber officinale TaxID=94328 RepID=A0A8J5KRP3_ZINOF|nr:hypothetical protein ZIOFF_051030 [Zingiber officinale]
MVTVQCRRDLSLWSLRHFFEASEWFRLFQKKRAQIRITSSRRASTVPMGANGVDASSIQSDSTMDQESPKHNDFEEDRPSLWTEGTKRKHLVSTPSFVFVDEIDAIAGRHARKDPRRCATFNAMIAQLNGE